MMRSMKCALLFCIIISVPGCSDKSNKPVNPEKTIRARVVSIPYLAGAHFNSEKAFSVLVEVAEPSADTDNLLLCYTSDINNLSPYTNAATIMYHAMVSGETIELTGDYFYLLGVGGKKELFKIHTLSACGYVIDLTMKF